MVDIRHQENRGGVNLNGSLQTEIMLPVKFLNGGQGENTDNQISAQHRVGFEDETKVVKSAWDGYLETACDEERSRLGKNV
jgi:hypothetical protein